MNNVYEIGFCITRVKLNYFNMKLAEILKN
jgi:hypothetical protein